VIALADEAIFEVVPEVKPRILDALVFTSICGHFRRRDTLPTAPDVARASASAIVAAAVRDPARRRRAAAAAARSIIVSPARIVSAGIQNAWAIRSTRRPGTSLRALPSDAASASPPSETFGPHARASAGSPGKSAAHAAAEASSLPRERAADATEVKERRER